MKLLQSQLKTSNHLSFYMILEFRAFAGYPFFFLLGPYPLSTLACQFLHVSLLLMSLFLHTSLFHASSIISWPLVILGSPRFREAIFSGLSQRASCIISRHSIILDSPRFCKTRTAPVFLYLSAVGRLAQGQRSERRKF